MGLDRNTRLSMALSFAGSFREPIPPLRISSSRCDQPESVIHSSSGMSPSYGTEPRGDYRGVSVAPLSGIGWWNLKPGFSQCLANISLKRWDGAARVTTDWDSLRRDPELWQSNGDCLVHLYNQGQSRRGPSLKIPFEVLVDAGCGPLLDKFLDKSSNQSPLLEAGGKESRSGRYELYIPAPSLAKRGQAMLHHIATRNFFAFLFRRPLVGSHLGGALVGLLRSMDEFRSPDTDSVADILHYMDAEGYSDMRGQPDYALAVLFFAEHFHFRDLWIKAFIHSVGMNERLHESSEYEHINRASRAMISRGRFEMDIRLDGCGRSLSTFLEDELSAARFGLPSGARAHLDRFRTFLQSYYVAKLGYYPPLRIENGSSTFPKTIYATMRTEFGELYDFLADNTITAFNCGSFPAQGGINVLQNVQAFDKRYHFTPLKHPLPLLPVVTNEDPPKTLSRRLSWVGKPDKARFNERLITLSALSKASNRHRVKLLERSLVKAYCAFEKEYVFSNGKADRDNKLSTTDARKVRWIMVYTMLQTLLAATNIPHEVRGTQDVPYNLCALTAGCPLWKDETPRRASPCVEKSQLNGDMRVLIEGRSNKTNTSSSEVSDISGVIKPDVDRSALSITPPASVLSFPSVSKLRTSSVQRALSTLGNMPELRHPKPLRASYHEILVRGYSGRLNAPIRRSSTPVFPGAEDSPSDSDPTEWRNANSGGKATPTSLPSSISGLSSSRRGSDGSLEKTEAALYHAASGSLDSRENEVVLTHLQPRPLDLSVKTSTGIEAGITLATKQAEDNLYSSISIAEVNPELDWYLSS